MNEPAHKILVDRFLNWDKVRVRLEKSHNIGRHFTLAHLKACSQKAPYYCHYLSWRLGTWSDEKPIEFFDELLGWGSSLPNWNSNRSLFSDCRFDQYWSLLWQLQVAKMFENNGATVEWMKSGPDLRIKGQGKPFFVECYTYRKSFGTKEFIQEVFGYLDPGIILDHTLYTPLSLPKDKSVESFLGQLFRPYLDPSFLETKRREAEKVYPVLLPVPEGIANFYVVLRGDDPDKYDPRIHENASGAPEGYLEVAFREALDNKRNSNSLQHHRPNLLAINFALSLDFQTASSLRPQLNIPLPPLEFGTSLDAVLYSDCGIVTVPTSQTVFLKFKESTHPAAEVLSEHQLSNRPLQPPG